MKIEKHDLSSQQKTLGRSVVSDPVVFANRVLGVALFGAVYRRLCDVLPISFGCSSGPAGAEQERKSSLTLEPTKTKLVEFGRFAQRHAGKHGRRRPETIYFLGFTLYCTRNLKGNFRIGMRTERARPQRTLMRLQDLMRRMRHLPVREQVDNLNLILRGHYAYFGIAGNFRALHKAYRAVERYWHKMLCSRNWKGAIIWSVFHRIRAQSPLLRPKLYLPYRELQAMAML